MAASLSYKEDEKEIVLPLGFAVYIPESAVKSPEFIEVIAGAQAPDKFARLSVVQVALVMAEEGDYTLIAPADGVRIAAGEQKRKIAAGVLVAKSDAAVRILALSPDVLPLIKIAHRHFTRRIRLDLP